jgi:hypothetical protein
MEFTHEQYRYGREASSDVDVDADGDEGRTTWC